ncbi:MAG: protein-glutamate O-methyltransferase CheR [Gemmatimonadales bacterium]
MGISAATFEYIRTLVIQRSAIVLDAGKEYLVESRLGPIARAEGFATVDDLAVQLGRTSFNTLHRRVIEAMTTNETTFFRDIHPFDALRTVVFPELIAARSKERRLNFWCGAASSGQEPYTVCMIVREHFPELRNWKFNFLATDLSSAMRARARAGRYSQLEVNRGLPAPLLLKYFKKDGTEWVIDEEIRRMVDYQELNLAERWPAMARMDVVMMRNVLIYFDTDMKREIMRKVRGVMAPDGYFILGSAETTMAIDDAFERAPIGKSVAYRLAGAGARRQHVGV